MSIIRPLPLTFRPRPIKLSCRDASVSAPDWGLSNRVCPRLRRSRPHYWTSRARSLANSASLIDPASFSPSSFWIRGRWQTRLDDPQPRPGTLTQRHARLVLPQSVWFSDGHTAFRKLEHQRYPGNRPTIADRQSAQHSTRCINAPTWRHCPRRRDGSALRRRIARRSAGASP
jgi:hypothetical protein